MIEVEFIRANAPYAPGDIASVSKERAAVFVGASVARLHVRPAPEEKAMAPKMTAVVRSYTKKG